MSADDSELDEGLNDDINGDLDGDLNLDVSKDFTRSALIRWTIRTIIGAVIASVLAWRYPWGKYLLYVWIPVSLLSLATILLGGRYLKSQVEGIEQQLDELRDMD